MASSPPPFDASPLWWPPATCLHVLLAGAAVDPGGPAAQGLESALRQRRPWLLSGLATFKPPSPASAAALSGSCGPSLSLSGGKSIPIEPALVGDALELSAVAVRDLMRGMDWEGRGAGAALGEARPSAS